MALTVAGVGQSCPTLFILDANRTRGSSPCPSLLKKSAFSIQKKFGAPFTSSIFSCPSVHLLRQQGSLCTKRNIHGNTQLSDRSHVVSVNGASGVTRREAIIVSGTGLWAFLLLPNLTHSSNLYATEFTDMPALRGKDYGKSRMSYPDYVQTNSGLQYKDLRDGVGPNPEEGDQVVVDWAGYTVGYYGRIFEARNKAKGGSFEGNEKGYFKFKLGGDQVIPAFEEAIKTMQTGGIRRIIVPAEIGYPHNDYTSKGPKPGTYSGQRALDFVLKNQGLIDKTLLFDIELLKIVKD